MTLFLFNPSHDEALAAHSPYYYPSKAARALTAEWCTLPALWASPGDAVLVPDEVSLPFDADSLPDGFGQGVRWVHARELNTRFWSEVNHIEPWGWDLTVRQLLRKSGAPETLLPSDETLHAVRRLSSRETTARLLPQFKEQLKEVTAVRVVGESVIARSEEEVNHLLEKWHGAMVKSLWSCSGRGVFHLDRSPAAPGLGRVRRLLREQGGVELQPFYERRVDFALEFEIKPSGEAVYLGPSCFMTHPSGAYSGNLVASPDAILHHLSAQLGEGIPLQTIAGVCCRILSDELGRTYVGPVGIDLMTVSIEGETALMPCVEINLRRTMGHAALRLGQLSLKAASLPPGIRKLWYFCPA